MYGNAIHFKFFFFKMLKLTAICPKAQFAPPTEKTYGDSHTFPIGGWANFCETKDIQNNPPQKRMYGKRHTFFFKKSKNWGGKVEKFASQFDQFTPPSYILSKLDPYPELAPFSLLAPWGSYLPLVT